MIHPINLDYLERIQAKCPKDHAVVFACGKRMYELVEIKYGALIVRDVEHLKFTFSEPYELNDRHITGYWYMGREDGKVKQEY